MGSLTTATSNRFWHKCYIKMLSHGQFMPVVFFIELFKILKDTEISSLLLKESQHDLPFIETNKQLIDWKVNRFEAKVLKK